MTTLKIRSRTGEPFDFQDGLSIKGDEIGGINGGKQIGIKAKLTDTEPTTLQKWVDEIIDTIKTVEELIEQGPTNPTSPDKPLDDDSTSNANTSFVHDLIARELAKVIDGATSPFNTLRAIVDELSKKVSLTDLQSSSSNYATGLGSPNAITAIFTPNINELKDGMVVRVKASTANTDAVTFTPNNGIIPFYPVQKGADVPLVAGDIAYVGYPIWIQWNATSSKWQMINPASGSSDDVLANLTAILDTLAPKNNPHFYGLPTVPTAELTNSTNQIANTQFVQQLIATKLDSVTKEATESSPGFVSFANAAETIDGTLKNKVIAPINLKNWFDNLPQATSTTRSTMRTATPTEAFEGLLDNVVLTPKTVKMMIDQAIAAYSGVSTPPVAPTVSTSSTSTVGSPITLNISSTSTTSGASISSFALTIDNGEVINLTANSNKAVYTWTPAGGNGSTVSLSVTAKDSNNKVSTATLMSISIYSVSVNAPNITAPTSGQTSVVISPTIQTTAFSVANGTDTHATTEYAIWTDVGRTGTKKFELISSTDKLSTFVPVGLLDHDTLYYISARHIGSVYGASAWTESSFRTVVQAAAPLITGATSVQIGQNYVLQLSSLPQPPATSIVSYTVTVNDGTPNVISATSNAATFTWPSTLTSAQVAGSVASIEITFTDNTGAVSKVAKKSVDITAVPITAPTMTVSAIGIDKGETVVISVTDNGMSPGATAITKATIKINSDIPIDITDNVTGVYSYTIPSSYTTNVVDGTVLNIVATVTDDAGVVSIPTTKQIYVNNVKRPVVIAPLQNASGVSVTTTLSVDAFSTFNDTDTHTFTNWRLYDAANVIVWESLNNTANKTSIAVPAYTLTGTTDYYLTVEFNGLAYGLSGECDKVKFTTMVFTLPAAPTAFTNISVCTNYKSSMVGSVSGAKLVTGDAIVGFKYWLNGTYVGQFAPTATGGTSGVITLWSAGTTVHDNKLLGETFKMEFATVYASGAQSAKLTKTITYTGTGKPTFSAPLVTSTSAALTQSITTSAFVSATNFTDTHAMSDFETHSLINGVRTLVFSSYNNATNKTSIAHTAGVLKNGLTYVSRVRYKGTTAGWSAWNEVTWSTIKAVAPVLSGATVGPLPGASYELTMTPTIPAGVGVTSFMVSVAGAAAIEVLGTGTTLFNLGATYTTGKAVASTIAVTAYVKYNNGSISATSAVKTITIAGIKTPTISTSTAPTSVTPTFTTAAFATIGITDTHAMTDFEIWSAAGRTGTLIWSSLNNTTNKLSISVPSGKLSFGTKVYFATRHKGTTYGWSGYKELGVTPTVAPPPSATSFWTSPGYYGVATPAGYCGFRYIAAYGSAVDQVNFSITINGVQDVTGSIYPTDDTVTFNKFTDLFAIYQPGTTGTMTITCTATYSNGVQISGYGAGTSMTVAF